MAKKDMKKEINRLLEKNKRLERRTDAKYLHRLEQQNRKLTILLRVKELHIGDLLKEISELKKELFQQDYGSMANGIKGKTA